MSVVLGDTPKQEPRDSALKADGETHLAASLPLSVTVWVYFDDDPGESDTYTVFWRSRRCRRGARPATAPVKNPRTARQRSARAWCGGSGHDARRTVMRRAGMLAGV
jgi:hypothetical protein